MNRSYHREIAALARTIEKRGDSKMKALLAILGFIVTITFGYLGMTLGWGLEVKSWGWLIFSYIMTIVGYIAISATN